MVNLTGANGTDNGVFPPNNELRDILLEYERRSLALELRLRYLERDHQIKIKLTKLKALNKKFEIPSARKFRAAEEATTAIADIIARDIHQGQGPDTVKKIASLRLNLTLPRPKQRGTLDAIGVFQEIHVDGHEKLGEKALRMGPGIGIDTYGARDHVGKVLHLVVVPNSRLSDTIGHVFLDMVSAYQAISVQVTFDGGSELGWLSAFQTTLRELFAPELSVNEWKPVVAVKSSSNIPIESTWSYDRQFNGRTLRDVLEEGRIYLIPGDAVHRNLFRWLWPKIVQIGLDEFVDYFNNKKTRKQHNRKLPSGVAPNVVFDMPGDYGLQNLAIPITPAAIEELRAMIETPREEAFRWVSDEFNVLATQVYEELGSPKMEALTGWAIFNAMAPLIRSQVDYEILM
ncbi:hypothetical protein C8R45DRAFT_975356 [Mycena sanguinolenta]|nr:hypothetical protein C8R45DRAFT_975356 [Mycena sanguinolenta]